MPPSIAPAAILPPDFGAAPDGGPSLRRGFMGLMLAALLLPALLFASIVAWTSYQTSKANLHEQLAISVNLSTAALNDHLAQHMAAITIVAKGEPNKGSWKAELESLQQASPGVLTALVTNGGGDVVSSFPIPRRVLGQEQSNVADRDYFKVPAATGRPYVSNAFRGRKLGQDPLVAIAAPLYRNGIFDGVVEASIDIESLTRERAAAFQRRGWEMVLLDREMNVIFASNGTALEFMQSLAGSSAVESNVSQSGNFSARKVAHLLTGDRMAWVTQSSLRCGWQLLLIAPDDLVVSHAYGTLWPLLGAIVLVMIGASAAGFWGFRALDLGVAAVLRSLQRLPMNSENSVMDLAQVPRELRPIGRAMTDLASHLFGTQSSLRQALEEQRRLSSSLHTTIAAREQEIAIRTNELSAANAELAKITQIDPLTGVLNVRGLRERLAGLSLDGTSFDKPTAVLALDVDYFKSYNDRYGHPAGDRVLARVAHAIQGALRDSKDVVARTGGEEFTVVLPNADQRVAESVAERIRRLVASLDILHEGSDAGRRITLSIGGTFAAHGALVDGALARADEALYSAKHSGRNKACINA